MRKRLCTIWLFVIFLTLTSCGQKARDDGSLLINTKDNEELTVENAEHNSVEESATTLYWKTLLNELYWGEHSQFNKSIQIELYLNSVAEQTYGNCLSYIDNIVYISEIYAEDKAYGKYVCGEAGIYDADSDYAQSAVEKARIANVFSVVGTVETNVSNTLNGLLKESKIEERSLLDLVTVCIQYICDEYVGRIGDIEGELDAKFYLTDISIDDNYLSGSGWFSILEETGVEIMISLNLDSGKDDHQNYDYDIVTGNITTGETVESLFSFECNLKTECK